MVRNRYHRSHSLSSHDALEAPQNSYRFQPAPGTRVAKACYPLFQLLTFAILALSSPVLSAITKFSDEVMRNYLTTDRAGLARLNAPCVQSASFHQSIDRSPEFSSLAKTSINPHVFPHGPIKGPQQPPIYTTPGTGPSPPSAVTTITWVAIAENQRSQSATPPQHSQSTSPFEAAQTQRSA
ncbi:MAG: hypothetical protein Q9225_007298 [Loekoesia sp. 1 TL-2023]